ncbi:hypothetical protein CC78DRAFT_531591 [Lojkania enalia]|uniref:Uncharacterized protein n=1 Tax=Lojkania enalia TaxID=147567 RepID=A0A9P4KHV2_9PLEO|nr:hypothetical protein CC78DRAFT_531591 [Didymosphaeria enalia]
MPTILSPVQRLLNLLLPFTDPSTPLIQDLLHTLIICSTLYFGPQLVELYKSRQNRSGFPDPVPYDEEPAADPTNDLPIDENFVLQPDTDDEVEPPPHAPTPPPGQGPAAWPADAQIPFPEHEQGEPANIGDRPHPTPANRVVGAKKAKSLARKDQRRAYHEFHRQQAEMRRAEEAKDAPAREAALEAERKRRAEVEKEIQERERAERERKKEEERREHVEERERRERVIRIMKEELEAKGAVDLVDLAWHEGKDALWIERLTRASGLLAQSAKAEPGAHIMITAGGWLVRIDAQLMREAYTEAVSLGNKNEGKVSFAEFGDILESAVRARAQC